MSDRHRSPDSEGDEPSIETRIEALAHRVDWIDRDRLGIRPKLWVWMVEWLLTVAGALILGFLVVGASGVLSWDVVIGMLDTYLSAIIGAIAVLTFIERAVWVIGEWRDRSRENRSLIEGEFEDDP